MRLTLCIASATPALFNKAVDLASKNAALHPLQVFGFGNGCYLTPRNDGNAASVVHSVAQNIGVPAALHRLYEMAANPSFFPGSETSGDQHVLAYIHDDLLIEESGWDTRVLAAFERDPKLGLVGFGGSTALGGDEIYKKPYEIHQLGRRDFWSNMNGAEVHGKRTTEERPIVFTDGMSMILRRSLLDTIGGWSWWPFEHVHHAYDYGIACMARRHGYTARLVPCAVHHIGGQTAMMAVHQDMAKKYGGDNAVHAASHKFVYETFRDVLPLRLK